MAKGISAKIRLTAGGPEQKIVTTIQGTMDENGTFHGTGLGRGGKPLEITEAWPLIVEFNEPSNGHVSTDRRTIELGPGVTYRYGEQAFVNEAGVILQEMTGFDDLPTREPVPPGAQVGGAMPTTIFVARELPGITIAQ